MRENEKMRREQTSRKETIHWDKIRPKEKKKIKGKKEESQERKGEEKIR